ncbi:MAG: choice-of-anchor Q domain-containing protein [Polyangiales bacterium]
MTAAEILIDKDVTLDGEGNLTVDGKDDHLVFAVNEGVIAELTGFTVTRGRTEFRGGCISNDGTLTLTNSTVTRCTAAENPDPERSNSGGGIANAGSLMLMNSTVSENSAVFWGGGIANSGTLTLTNSTVSNNTVPEHVGFGSHVGGGISNNGGTLTLTNSTISGNTAQEYTAVQNINEGTLTVAGSVIDGTCGSETVVMSIGYNIESPGDTCGFDQTGDQPGVTAEQLNLGPLAENGGPTETHALLPGSVAIDQIPVVDCVDADGEPLTTDQRGLPRPQGGACDVGAFELEVAP